MIVAHGFVCVCGGGGPVEAPLMEKVPLVHSTNDTKYLIILF